MCFHGFSGRAKSCVYIYIDNVNKYRKTCLHACPYYRSYCMMKKDTQPFQAFTRLYFRYWGHEEENTLSLPKDTFSYEGRLGSVISAIGCFSVCDHGLRYRPRWF